MPREAMESSLSASVRNNQKDHRFELEHDGHLAVSHYRLAPGVITFMHTEVPAELAGRGIGSLLIAGALDEARRLGLKVAAECPFVDAFIDKHPAYGDLLSDGSAGRGAEPKSKSNDDVDKAAHDKEHLDELLDEALRESFPASDPPAVSVKD